MRKLVLYLVTILLLALSALIVLRGVILGPIIINSFKEISDANNELDELIDEAVDQKEVKYTEALNQQQTAYKTLMSEKASYQQLLDLGVDENGIPLSKIQEYEIEKIWITLGNYAEKQCVDLRMDITVNNSVAKTYDLNFTVVGEYIQIADFLYDIQRDNTLVFKIENFKLVSSEQIEETTIESNEQDEENDDVNNQQTEVTDYNLTATFVCKDIRLNIVDPVPEDTNSETTGANNPSTQSTQTTTQSTTTESTTAQ